MDDEHVVAFIEAVDRTYLDAVHVLALDAVFIDDVGHHGSGFCLSPSAAAPMRQGTELAMDGQIKARITT
jgi:hypothetical protein